MSECCSIVFTKLNFFTIGYSLKTLTIQMMKVFDLLSAWLVRRLICQFFIILSVSKQALIPTTKLHMTRTDNVILY